MDWSDTQEQAAFRDEVRSLIAERLPQRYRSLAQEMHGGERVWQFDRSSEEDGVRASAIEWADALSERGWVAPHWPREYGGAGLGVIGPETRLSDYQTARECWTIEPFRLLDHWAT